MFKNLHLILITVILFVQTIAIAQQYPWWTQYRSNSYVLNPAFCGTNRMVDIKINYRKQWSGFQYAPKTFALSLNSRFMKGKLGAGAFMFRDEIGPFQTTNLSFTGAYHLKFADSELSVGLQGNYIYQNFIGTRVTLHNQQDMAINQALVSNTKQTDVSFGILYYNDRFHLGVGANNVKRSEFEYYKSDTLRNGKFKNEPHVTFSLGYNWAEDPRITYENSIMSIYTQGTPFILDYTLRVHFKSTIYTGFSLRFKDAIGLLVGYTIKNTAQIGYSYDFLTSPLRRYQSGSHEIKLSLSANLIGGTGKDKGFNKRFVKQKFQYLLH